jgi:hypothetical protein
MSAVVVVVEAALVLPATDANAAASGRGGTSPAPAPALGRRRAPSGVLSWKRRVRAARMCLRGVALTGV